MINPKEYQTDQIKKVVSYQEGFQEKFVRSSVDVVFGGGVLNPQPLDSLVSTPYGFKAMGDIKVGDVIVNPKGGTQEVLFIIDKEEECVEFTLEDGRRVKSALSHHWMVYDDKGRTKEMTSIEFLLNGRKYGIPSSKVMKHEKDDIKTYWKSSAVKRESYRFLPKQPVRCINVSGNEHLYLTDGYLITCNCGKAQPLYSLVSTPYGFKTIGELKVGDVINDTQSGIQSVLNIYDRGEREVIRFHFDNGNHVDCCIEHLWSIVDVINKKTKTIEASEIIRMIDGGGKVHIPMSNPIHLEQRGNIPISPYILGVLVGDGSYTIEKGTITIDTDQEIVDRCNTFENLETTGRIDSRPGKRNYFAIHSKSIRKGLKDLNLMGCHSYNKFIPESYKYTSIENRIELIRGLFDTDGHQDVRSNRIEYTTTSEQLANDVKWVFESLGGKVSVNTKIGNYRNEDGEKVMCRKTYRLQCRIRNLNDFVSLKRKKVERGNLRNIYHRIVKYEKLDKQPMKCILVSNPNHLYLTDNFIVTHNTFSAILSVAEPSLDPEFRACFTRRTFGELKTGGGMVDDFQVAYGNNGCKIKETSPPRINFPSGAFVEMRQINDENIKKVTEQWKGAQFDFIYMDELTSYNFSTFKYLLTRNRGKAKWTGKFRGTTNPKKSSWVRTFIDWYINPMGQIYPDRDGVIRYFYIMGDDVRDVVWGDTKEEVYESCKIDIDRKLKALGGKFTYKNMIKSFTFYLGKMSENKASIGNNMDYAGSVAAVGGGQAQQLIEGNWNADEEEEGDIPIPSVCAREVFTNDPQVNGDKWITADLADYGSDNLVALVWDGLHVIDALVVGKSFPKMNADKLLMLATKWDVADSHIIYDAVGARYMNDYIPDAIPYISNNKPIGMYARGAYSLKADCYLRLCWMIREGLISWSPEVGERRYYHQLVKDELTMMSEFCEECSVVRFKETSGGKKRLFTKQEMNTALGKGRSMDVLDPMAMRMLPFVYSQYGDELSTTGIEYESREDNKPKKSEIYSDSFWA